MASACRFCGKEFVSRTKLFAHIRASEECSEAAVKEDARAAHDLAQGAKRSVIAVVIGYSSDGEAAEETIKQACARAGASDIQTSRASGHSVRGLAWQQHSTCAAVSDVLTVSFCSALVAEDLWKKAQDEMLSRSKACCRPEVHTFAAIGLQRMDAFNAEVSCTQRTYSYMLPLSVLFPSNSSTDDGFDPAMSCAMDPQRHKAYRELKNIFRTVVRPRGHMGPRIDGSHRVDYMNEDIDLDDGLTPHQARRSWHNFSEVPSNADQQTVVVQGMLHKFNLSEPEESHDKFAILRMSGGDFLTQQCQKLVAVVVCIFHGWLPPDFLITATRPDVIVSLPMAPAHLLYLEDCRFCHWERRHGRLNNGNSANLNKPKMSSDAPRSGPLPGVQSFAEPLDQVHWLQQLQMTMSGLEFCEGALSQCDLWLDQLQKVEVPRMRKQLDQIGAADALSNPKVYLGLSAPPIDDCPPVYQKTLCLLRAAAASEDWPDASKARTGYIHGKGGGTLSIGRVGSWQHPTKGTSLFPQLATSIFELELAVAPQGRPPSTMVVVNRNAQFKPHVDSGEGKGQSKTLIVGLGDYTGGELVVEGEVHNLRYTPLEFEGSKQRHWTLPFVGERISLVFFSPSN